jgi:hypothetical protein
MDGTDPQKTVAWYDLQLKEVQSQLKTSNDALDVAKAKIAEIEGDEKIRLIDEIVKKSKFTADELKDKSVDELRVASVSLDKAKFPAKGIGKAGDSGTEAKPSGLTAGRWDPAKKDWVT